jgi:hypothetical protein
MSSDRLDALTADQRALYDIVPSDGSTITNPLLRKKLRWGADADEDRYFATRNAVEDAGLIARGRGRGGTVRRVLVASEDAVADPRALPAETPEAVAAAMRRELDLYEPLQRIIRAEWAKDHRVRPIAVEITAQQGRRATGMWARPDIVSVEVRTFTHVPGKYIEVVTFEVKPVDAINVLAVYEALAHRRAATHSYVLLHIPDKDRDELEPAVAEIAEVARGHGIGVITVEDPSDYETWEEREAAQRVVPDPGRLDAFIGQQLGESVGREIGLAVR